MALGYQGQEVWAGAEKNSPGHTGGTHSAMLSNSWPEERAVARSGATLLLAAACGSGTADRVAACSCSEQPLVETFFHPAACGWRWGSGMSHS